MQPWNEQHLLGHRGEFPYDLAGISVGTRSDRAKAPYGELAKPRLSRCDSGCVSRIKFAARIARVIWRDLIVHLLPTLVRIWPVSGPFLARFWPVSGLLLACFWPGSAKATRVVSSRSAVRIRTGVLSQPPCTELAAANIAAVGDRRWRWHSGRTS